MVAALDECLLDEDIGGFVGAYLIDIVEAVKKSAVTMKNIFSDMKTMKEMKLFYCWTEIIGMKNKDWNNISWDVIFFVLLYAMYVQE